MDKVKLKSIIKASQISLKTVSYLRIKLTPGITELELAHLAKKHLSKQGAEKLAFPTIIAFGSNSAHPHHKPTDRKLRQNDTVLIDLGAKYNEFCADFSRTYFLGKTTPVQHKVKAAVQTAYRAALKVVNQPKSVKAQLADQAARQVIKKAGFGKYFIHSTGHGLGKKIHQAPKISPKSNRYIKPGMAITIEPGIYLPNKFGYRYENTIIIK